MFIRTRTESPVVGFPSWSGVRAGKRWNYKKGQGSRESRNRCWCHQWPQFKLSSCRSLQVCAVGRSCQSSKVWESLDSATSQFFLVERISAALVVSLYPQKVLLFKHNTGELGVPARHGKGCGSFELLPQLNSCRYSSPQLTWIFQKMSWSKRKPAVSCLCIWKTVNV